MSFKRYLENSINEKDVENAYRSELIKIEGSTITSPYAVDGLLENKTIRSLLEFKYSENLKNKVSQCNILIQCVYYLKKFEMSGEKIPSTIFIGDINECFAIHTNSIIKYLASEIDWKIAPSEAYKKNPVMIQAMVDDVDILPFVFDIDDKFKITDVIDKIKDLSDNVIRKIRVNKNNIVTIFDYFNSNILTNVTLSTNEKANLFIQIIINHSENYIHPKKKNSLITKSFGELKINKNMFESFFQHFDDNYSPKEKEILTSLIDRLVDDKIRRSKGEFYTPTAWVNESHKMITESFGENWKDEYVVWDCCAGTFNLTRDYNFKNLFCSTIEQSDIDTAEQMGYNRGSTKFQFDFLNDEIFGKDSKVPMELQVALKEKKVIFFINPPYARAGNMTAKDVDHKTGCADTKVGSDMKSDKWGKASANMYSQFMYRISELNTIRNVALAIFSPSLYKTGSSFKDFREKFYAKFRFEHGMIFNASHFSDTADSWAIDFSVWKSGTENRDNLVVTMKDVSQFDGIVSLGAKDIYNMDNHISASNWIGNDGRATKIDSPKFKSSLSISNKGHDIVENSFGFFMCKSNNVYYNGTRVSIFNGGASDKGDFGLSVIPENFHKVCSLFTARKSIVSEWYNQKDEYFTPNESHPEWEQYTIDSIVYALFNNSSQQSSLRGIDYKDKKWDITNEWFWMSTDEMVSLAEDSSYDELYTDAKNSKDRFVYNKLFTEGVYDKLSPDAKEVIDIAMDLTRKSISIRKIVSESHPEYHLNSFDAGYAQLKLIWKEYFKPEFVEFRKKYMLLEMRLKEVVYNVGFLNK